MRSDPNGKEIASRDCAAADADQLEAAAAEIADQPVGVGDARDHAVRRQPRLLAARQHAPVDARARRTSSRNAAPLAASRTAAVATVSSVAHLHLARQQREAAERRAPAPSLLARAGRSSPSPRPRPAQHLLVEAGSRRRAAPVIDDEADRVRADVDDRRPAVGAEACPADFTAIRSIGPRSQVAASGNRRRCSRCSAAPRPDSDGIGHEIMVAVERLLARLDAVIAAVRRQAPALLVVLAGWRP